MENAIEKRSEIWDREQGNKLKVYLQDRDTAVPHLPTSNINDNKIVQ